MFSKRNWKNFLLNEVIEDRTIFTYIQGLQEFVNNFKPKTMTEKRRLSLANQQLKIFLVLKIYKNY